MTRKLIPILALSCLPFTDLLAQCNDPFNLTSSPAVLCSGRKMQLSATNYPGATYTWVGPAGSGVNGNLPATVNVNNIISTQHNGLYTVTVTMPGGCTYSASVNLFVESTPTKPLVSYKTPVCPEQTDTLTGFTSGVFGVTYYWEGPDNFSYSSALSNVAYVPNFSAAKAGEYKLWAISLPGCVSDTTDFTINLAPGVVTDFTPKLMYGCDEDSVLFENGTTGATTHAWTFGDGNSSTDQYPLHIYGNQGAYNVRLISRNAYCADTTDKVIDIKHFVKAQFSVDDDSICQNTVINFTNASTNDPGILPRYAWSFGDGAVTDDFNTSYNYLRYGVYQATLVVTDYLGCKDSMKKEIVVDSTGRINFTASETEICTGGTVSFTGDFMKLQNLGTIWDLGDGNTISGPSDITYSFDKAGIYPVTFKVDYRICPDEEHVVSINVKPIPKISLGEDRTICPNGQPLTLIDLINIGNSVAKWKWNNGEGSETSSIIVRSEGAYAATVDIDGCSATDTVVIKNNCYIRIPGAFSPNGDGNGDYFLPRQALSEGVTKFAMQIFNRWGEKVFETNSVDGKGWDGNLNGKQQPLGVYVYLINVSFEDGSAENYKGNVTLLR